MNRFAKLNDKEISLIKEAGYSIEEKGYNEGEFFVMLGTGMIIICIGLNEIRKRVSNQIDLIDKQEN